MVAPANAGRAKEFHVEHGVLCLALHQHEGDGSEHGQSVEDQDPFSSVARGLAGDGGKGGGAQSQGAQHEPRYVETGSHGIGVLGEDDGRGHKGHHTEEEVEPEHGVP